MSTSLTKSLYEPLIACMDQIIVRLALLSTSRSISSEERSQYLTFLQCELQACIKTLQTGILGSDRHDDTQEIS